MQTIILAVMLLGRMAAAAPIPPQPGSTGINNSASAQDARFNVGTGTVRGLFTADRITVRDLTATGFTFSGDGSAITNLNASQLLTGAVPAARLVGAFSGITGVGTLVSGVWRGTAVGTQWGGTGQNWSATPSGSIPVFIGTGIMGLLAPGPTSQLLQSTGSGFAWTGAPAITGANITGLLPANLSAGSLPTNVAVSQASIASLPGSKVTGNIAGLASNLSQPLPIGNIAYGILPYSVVATSITGTGVTPGIYGGAAFVPQLTVRSDGRMSAATQVALSINAPNIGPGTLPVGVDVPQANLVAGALPAGITVPQANIVPGTLPTNVVASSIAQTGVTPGTYGSATTSARIIVGADGRLSSASEFSIPGVSTRTAFYDRDNGWSVTQTAKSPWTFQASGPTRYSLGTSSGISVAAGGVTAPWFSGAHYGDGSRLTNLPSTEGSTYASPKFLTATGNTSYSLQASSGVSVLAGGVTAPWLSGDHYGDGSRLSNLPIPPAGPCGAGTGANTVLCQGSLNAANGDFDTISGGLANLTNGGGSFVGGGNNNQTQLQYAVAVGGLNNSVNSAYGTVGGGRNNLINGVNDTISGGNGNTTNGGPSGGGATVGGGATNLATGEYSTVPGGKSNTASGEASVALGYGATASHTRSMVYSQAATSSNRSRQVKFEAQGGFDVVSPALTVTGGAQLGYGLAATTASLTGTGSALYSLQTSSGVNVAAGGVTAPWLSGTHYGDGSKLSGISIAVPDPLPIIQLDAKPLQEGITIATNTLISGGFYVYNTAGGTLYYNKDFTGDLQGYSDGILEYKSATSMVIGPKATPKVTLNITPSDTVPAILTSSGISVSAGGVTAPWLSGTHYGDGSKLDNLPGETNTYASPKFLTATGNANYSLQTTSGISVLGGGVTAPWISGTHYGDGSNLSGISGVTDPLPIIEISAKPNEEGVIISTNITAQGDFLLTNPAGGKLYITKDWPGQLLTNDTGKVEWKFISKFYIGDSATPSVTLDMQPSNTRPSVTTSSGVLVQAGGVTAPWFSGDGSYLTGIVSGGETNTYTSTKTFISTVSAGGLMIGTTASPLLLADNQPYDIIAVGPSGVRGGRMRLYSYGSGATANGVFNFLTGRGTNDSPLALASGDNLGTIGWGGYAGPSSTYTAAVMNSIVSGACTVGAGCPSRLQISISTGGVNPTLTALVISSEAVVQMSSSAWVRGQDVNGYSLHVSSGIKAQYIDLPGGRVDGPGGGGGETNTYASPKFLTATGDTDYSLQTSSGISVLAGGVTAMWLSASSGIFTGTGDESMSIVASSGISVLAGGVTAPWFSGDASALTGTGGFGACKDISVSRHNIVCSQVAGNDASPSYSVVSGGANNNASASFITIAGGSANNSGASPSSDYSFIGGGSSNSVAGIFSTVPGGSSNTASGNWSFAQGRRAKAVHTGTFVIDDSQDADFSSTVNDQFSARYQGGVYFEAPYSTFTGRITASGGVVTTTVTASGKGQFSVGVSSFGVGGKIYYRDYATAVTTTTTGTAEVTFATATIPGGTLVNVGDCLTFRCVAYGVRAVSKTLYVTLGGSLGTRIEVQSNSNNGTVMGTSPTICKSDGGVGWHLIGREQGASTSGVLSQAVSFDETASIDATCGCSVATGAQGDCSFSYFKVTYEPR